MIILRDYAKVRKGITRDVLVSSEMTLHALHYVINRVFGWENSHLHHFMLPDEAFQRLTGGTNAPVEFGYTEYDGSFLRWADLCGVYFRFPTEELLERLTLRENIIPDTVSLNSNPFDGVDFLLKRQEQEDDDLPVIPLVRALDYEYDYGDGWRVKITCTESIHTEHQDVAKLPMCTATDGIMLMDDVGGVGGYIDFLMRLHEGEPSEREELRAWARGMGWTGRERSPKNIL